jgi:hypothetical protein
LKLKPFVVVLASIALTAVTPALASASVRPDLDCGSSLAIWVTHNDASVNVSGTVEPTCGGPFVPAFLEVERIGPGGSLTPVAYGEGEAVYPCNGTTPNNYEMGGDTDGITFTTGVIPCG